MRVFKFIIKAIFAVILAIILGHVFGLAGLFLTFSYAVLYFFIPGFVPCLGCNAVGKNNTCQFCKVNPESKVTRAPNSIRSLAFNTLLLVMISLISTGLVILEKNALESFGIGSVKRTAVFTIDRHGHDYRLDEVFPIKIRVSGAETAINTVQIDLKFDPARLQAIKVDVSESFANIFVQKDINNSLGYIRVIGGLPNPGFSGENGVFATLYFKGITPGVANISFLQSSLVLANDGKGTNILKEYASSSCLILPDKLSDDEKKVQESLLTSVLGEKTTRDATLLFDTNENIVSTKSELILEQPTQLQTQLTWHVYLLEKLHLIDSKIYAFWQELSNVILKVVS